MCREVFRRLQAEGFQTYRTVVVTVRFADFDTKSRSRTLAGPSAEPRRLRFEAMKLLMPSWIAGRTPNTNSSASSACGWKSWGSGWVGGRARKIGGRARDSIPALPPSPPPNPYN